MRYFLELTEDEVVSVEMAGMGMVVARTNDFIYLHTPGIQEKHDELAGNNLRNVSLLPVKTSDDGDLAEG
jgi:hypothetical protein